MGAAIIHSGPLAASDVLATIGAAMGAAMGAMATGCMPAGATGVERLVMCMRQVESSIVFKSTLLIPPYAAGIKYCGPACSMACARWCSKSVTFSCRNLLSCRSWLFSARRWVSARMASTTMDVLSDLVLLGSISLASSTNLVPVPLCVSACGQSIHTTLHTHTLR